jgi:hypothetical protein
MQAKLLCRSSLRCGRDKFSSDPLRGGLFPQPVKSVLPGLCLDEKLYIS